MREEGRTKKQLIEELIELRKRISELEKAQSDRGRLKRALQRNERQYRISIEAAPMGIVVTDPKDRILIFNPQLKTITGYSKEEIPDVQTWLEKIYPDKRYRKLVIEERKTISLEERPRTKEAVITRKNGEKRTCQFVSVLLPSKIRIVFINDITEHKKLEDQLYQAQKMEAVGRLAGGIAHDFNNLLGVIRGFSDLILENIKQHPLRSYSEEIKKASERGVSLVKQLLAFSRKQIVQPERLNLNMVIENMMEMLPRLIGEDIQIVKVLEKNLWKITADRGQIEQVIINLAVNARDAMPNGGKLVIQTKNFVFDTTNGKQHPEVELGKYVRLSISDTGKGMNEKTLSHIFEPFFTTKEQGKGTGLGLSMVYGIVKQNQGYIYPFSRVEKGSTFNIYLPYVEEVDRVSPKEEEEQDILKSLEGTETVLLVEDDESMRKFTKMVLQKYGYAIVEASDGEEALAISKEKLGEISLLITDVVMPKMSGRDLAKRLTQEDPDLRVIFLSGYAEDVIVHHGILYKGINFIQKPFDASTLLKKIREVLDKPHSQAK